MVLGWPWRGWSGGSYGMSYSGPRAGPLVYGVEGRVRVAPGTRASRPGLETGGAGRRRGRAEQDP